MNDQWKPEFITGEEIINKQFQVKDFAVYMNFSKDKKDVLYEELTKDWEETDSDLKYMRFLRQECKFDDWNNNFIVDRFKMEVRAQLNNNPKNSKPQGWANIVLGGDFLAGD